MTKFFFIIAFSSFCFSGFSQANKNTLITNIDELEKQFDNLNKKSGIVFLNGFYESFGKNAHDREIKTLKSKKLFPRRYDLTTSIAFRLTDDSAEFYVPAILSERQFVELRNVTIVAPVIIKARIFKDLKYEYLPHKRLFMIVENYNFKTTK